jgi:hypothetical protein
VTEVEPVLVVVDQVAVMVQAGLGLAWGDSGSTTAKTEPADIDTKPITNNLPMAFEYSCRIKAKYFYRSLLSLRFPLCALKHSAQAKPPTFSKTMQSAVDARYGRTAGN